MNSTPNRYPAVTVEDVLALEKALADPPVLGINVGSLLASEFNVALLNGRHSWNLVSFVKDCLRFCCRTSIGLGSWTIPPQIAPGKILLTLSEASLRFTGLMLPVLEALGAERCVVLPAPGARKLLPASVDVLHWDKLPPIDMRAWRKECLHGYPVWYRRFSAFQRQFGLPAGMVPALLDAAAAQTQRILKHTRLLEIVRPAAVVTEYDRFHLAAPLIMAAKMIGIPTITLCHGPANALFLPLLADTVCCWGQLDQALFLDHGVAPGRAAITGSPRVQRPLPIMDGARRRAIASSNASHVVLLATSPIADALRIQLVRDFCQAACCLPDAAVLVRLHSSEALAEYKVVARQYPGVKFLLNGDCTLDEAIATSDVVVVHNSSFGLDALIKGRAVVVLDSLPGKWSMVEEMIALGRCPAARDSMELKRVLATLLADGAVRKQVLERAETYVLRRCRYYGDDAARRIAELVEARVAWKGAGGT